MKKFEILPSRTESAYEDIYVGTVEEVSALYKAICRASKSGNTNISAFYRGFPKFNPDNLYGLDIIQGDYSSPEKWMLVLSSDTVLRLIVDEDIKEVK